VNLDRAIAVAPVVHDLFVPNLHQTGMLPKFGQSWHSVVLNGATHRGRVAGEYSGVADDYLQAAIALPGRFPC